MRERSHMVAWVRGEVVGPSVPVGTSNEATFSDGVFLDSVQRRRGPLVWKPTADSDPQEVLYFDRETPHRRYGVGLLHPGWPALASSAPPETALEATDTLGVEISGEEAAEPDDAGEVSEAETTDTSAPYGDATPENDPTDEFEVTGADLRHPVSMAISFCVELPKGAALHIRLPAQRRFPWQAEGDPPVQLNGRYERARRRWNEEGRSGEDEVWRRVPAAHDGSAVAISAHELVAGRATPRQVELRPGSPLRMRVQVFPRRLHDGANTWLLTVVLRNTTPPSASPSEKECILYQSFFEVAVEGGRFRPYPESRRPFGDMDPDEQSLALLYREGLTWAIGHGCAAGWESEPGETPEVLFADVMPTVELPSMTPDIEIAGQPIVLSMRELATLDPGGSGSGWTSLDRLVQAYAAWIASKRQEAAGLPAHFAAVAERHLIAAEACHARITTGLALLRGDGRVLTAFRLANLAMLLQQFATKQLTRRPLEWNGSSQMVTPGGDHVSPWDLYSSEKEQSGAAGMWRAFQVAFLLMSLGGLSDEPSEVREIVDLIWFPTGGGKTEAYLGLVSTVLFYERLVSATDDMKRDGTNVLMRYTLRMLTTQQFQRAASLLCAMEFMRRRGGELGLAALPGARFSLGLWIGGDGSPNNVQDARRRLVRFAQGDVEGNPLILTECPWCRAELGRIEGARPGPIRQAQWNRLRVRGVVDDTSDGPLLVCSDRYCEFGGEEKSTWLPIEVIDSRIYLHPPSLVIATADKLAMVAYKPEARTLFGREVRGGDVVQVRRPPTLIIQDELHLISGPLGTMYALYEAAFERLCSLSVGAGSVKPRIVASTATVRGAAEQVKALYARNKVQLFPSPGLLMSDSFFGTYARQRDGRLRPGRLYVGIHGNDYGSVLTSQVRAFSAALFAPYLLGQEERDPFWTLLAFYNSIRELSGARTLFDSDIPSRLKFLFNREGYGTETRRRLAAVEELTSRLSQSEIVTMMDRLSTAYEPGRLDGAPDACLASSIIEVGVDIDRLSLMGIVGQPKTTATYIQVSGRVGRRWWQRPGLVLMLYNPSKSRDRSHYEQFHSYHRRLYERVEPTTATPFALSALQRGTAGVLIAWARQNSAADVRSLASYSKALAEGHALLRDRCAAVQDEPDRSRSLAALDRLRADLETKWRQLPQTWQEFPQRPDGEYLMLWPGQFATALQKRRGAVVPSSMRNVDGSAELTITQGYALASQPATAPGGTRPSGVSSSSQGSN